MNKKETKAIRNIKNVNKLNATISEYINSGMSMSDFIKRHLFEEYKITGNKELEEIAAEYFIDHLD